MPTKETYRYRARKLFHSVYGDDGPWQCTFCENPITYNGGRSFGALFVHHMDEDYTNNDIGNLAATHSGCHSVYHNKGRKLSEQTRANMSKGQIGRFASNETRAKIAAAHIGRKATIESKEKMRQSRLAFLEKVK